MPCPRGYAPHTRTRFLKKAREKLSARFAPSFLQSFIMQVKYSAEQGNKQTRGTKNDDLHTDTSVCYFGISICAYFDRARRILPRTATVAASATISLLTAKEFLRVST